jgi:hypothetical protein
MRAPCWIVRAGAEGGIGVDEERWLPLVLCFGGRLGSLQFKYSPKYAATIEGRDRNCDLRYKLECKSVALGPLSLVADGLVS